MDDKIFLGKLDASVEAIKRADDGRGANEVLFQTMKMLLRKIDNSEGCLAGYDKLQIMKHFLSFDEVAQSARDFFVASNGYALGDEVKRSLEATTQEIARISALLVSLERNNAELMRAREELGKITETYERANGEVFRLQKMKESVSNDVVKAMERINTLKAQIEKFKEQYRQLGPMLADMAAKHNYYNQHLWENDAVAQKLKEYGIPSIDDFFNRCADFKRSMEISLAEFDGIIRGVIEKQEEVKESIEKRNGTST